jgi:SPP1 family predicted phage head-tail adaptor
VSGVADYRHRVTLQQRATVVDNEGFATEQWQDWVTVWAAVEPIRGREYFAAAAVNAQNDVRIRIRYRPGVTPDMRVVYGQRVFDIQSVIDVDERHREIQLMCREVTDGG